MSVIEKASVANVSEKSAIVERLRQPEYTGRNRCLPCTIVNLLIAGLLSLALGAFTSSYIDGLFLGLVISVSSLIVFATTIYLRGYLIPYTPSLTKRYFPDRVLRWFEKGNQSQSMADAEPIDVEAFLLDTSLLEECATVDDWCLSSEFRERWHDAMSQFDDKSARSAAIADLLDVDPGRLDVVEFENAAAVKVDGRQAGQWESDAAFRAELAADRVLPEFVADWESMHLLNRSRVLNSLRMFLEECPTCGAPLSMGQERVESCCRSFDVVAVTCESCEARVFEIEASGGAMQAA